MNPNLRLGSLFGIPIGVTWGWFLIFGFVLFTAAQVFFPRSIPGQSELWYWSLGFLASLLFFGSLLAHELAHSLLARAYRLPVKGITLFILGGVSQITRDARTPLSEGLIAGAGPAVSFLLAAFFGLVALGASDANQAVATLGFYLAFVNLNLGIFNLLPAFPLDGGRVLRSILWGVTGNYVRATRWAARGGQVMGWGIVAVGAAVLLAGGAINGLIIGMVGFFIAMTAGQALRQEDIRARLSPIHVRHVMARSFPAIPRWTTLEEMASLAITQGSSGAFLVTDGSRFQGLVALTQLRTVPRDRWAFTTAQEIMVPARNLPSLSPDQSLFQALETLEEHQLVALPVLEDGQLAGVVTLDQVWRILQLRADLRI